MARRARSCGGTWAACSRRLNPHTFHIPAAEGLAEWFEELNALARDKPDKAKLVAEVDGVVAGMIVATLHEPLDPLGRELQTDFNRWRLHIDLLCVAGAHRRHGVGSALMQSAEAWGRERGAEVVILETEANNPMSVPFYGQRMGFSAEVLVLPQGDGRRQRDERRRPAPQLIGIFRIKITPLMTPPPSPRSRIPEAAPPR